MFRKLTLIATTVAALFSWSTAFAEDEVKLGFASLNRDMTPASGQCPSCYNVFGEIEVKNIAPSKEVWIMYNTGVGGWKSQKAVYDTKIGNNKETWDFYIRLGFVSPANIQIAIQYKVNGNVYWDNNGTKNYTLGGTKPFNLFNKASLFPGDNVKGVIDKFIGSVVVKNIARDKKVKIVYSLDKWITSKEVYATFGTTDGTAAETWNFTVDIPAFFSDSIPNIQYFIIYTTTGASFTDNNHGLNYKVGMFETRSR